MSTTCSIIIKEKNNKEYEFCKHWDGYPSGVGYCLKDVNIDELIGLDIVDLCNCTKELECFCEYFYEFNLIDKTINIYNYKYEKGVYLKNDLIYTGTIKNFIDKCDEI